MDAECARTMEAHVVVVSDGVVDAEGAYTVEAGVVVDRRRQATAGGHAWSTEVACMLVGGELADGDVGMLGRCDKEGVGARGSSDVVEGWTMQRRRCGRGRLAL